jgi:hypothetical protein
MDKLKNIWYNPGRLPIYHVKDNFLSKIDTKCGMLRRGLGDFIYLILQIPLTFAQDGNKKV